MGDYERINTDFMPQNAAENDSLWELLSVYADGEATPAEAAQIEALLRSDSALKRELDFMRLASSFAASEPEIAPPAELRDLIFAATVARPTFRRRLATAWTNAAASLLPRYALAGGLAGAALLTVALWPHNNGKPTAPKIATQPTTALNQIAKILPLTETEPKISVRPTGIELANAAPKASDAKPTAPAPIETKPMIVATAETKTTPRIADANTAPKTNVISISSTHPKKAQKHSTIVKTPQTPAPAESSEPTTIAYSPRPDMDRNNQRPTTTAEAPDKDLSLPDDKTAETPAPQRPLTIASVNTAPKTERHEGRYLGPPDNARQMTPSFMRQQRQASNAGYNDQAINSIKQNQIRLGTVWRF